MKRKNSTSVFNNYRSNNRVLDSHNAYEQEYAEEIFNQQYSNTNRNNQQNQNQNDRNKQAGEVDSCQSWKIRSDR